MRTCALVFYTTRVVIGRNITNHSLEKKKAPCFDLFWQQNNLLSSVFALKMDDFVLKVRFDSLIK